MKYIKIIDTEEDVILDSGNHFEEKLYNVDILAHVRPNDIICIDEQDYVVVTKKFIVEDGYVRYDAYLEVYVTRKG